MINHSEMNIRDALLEDLADIVQIYNSTVAGRMVTADTEPVSVQSREKWFMEHSAHLRPLWVMEYRNEICGWLSFQSFYGRPAYNCTVEISIYIAEKYRKKGIGRMFLQKALDFCPEIGVKNLLGFIFGHNNPSLNLFYSFGFSNWGVLPGIAELDGIQRDLVIVGKKI